ncbi:glycoside hydrolase family 2 TIM barrel-domain containing protein [uncultured Polaribacter sp.]|uniref:glycoside hydrolase family 2 protein n=1 Tax=uncultured Polaribacter sp. TaxID=174711 RepID=UPI002638A749|nr:glycoside hydrolase family 2 TIM barrel-domain containing protein [uncultured Polaribacter sp.]
MQKNIFIVFLMSITFQLASQNSTFKPANVTTDRTKTNINLDWKFHYGDVRGKPYQISFNDKNWKDVSLPHSTKLVSYALDSVQETWVQEKFLRNNSWYRKEILIPKKETNKVFLEFEAVHNATELWVNGKKAGSFEVNGYVPFHFDITDFVEFGKQNIIAIKADNTYRQDIAPDPHRTDYIKFGGIYRDVYLTTTNKMHVTYNWEDYTAGVHITTPTVNDKNGTVSIKTTVKNEYPTAQNARIETFIINENGTALKKLVQAKNIAANSTATFYQTTTIEEDYNQWSPKKPYLYRAYSVIYKEDKPVDRVENTFGFRTFKLVKGKGLILNGKPLFLVGANRHQSYPNIGDAVPNSFHYNEALQFKNAGFNAVRLSHYTQDDAFIKACDELGLIVYEEVSTWIEYGDKAWFEKLNDATRQMIRNHRNHPSIFFWGAGINHRGPVPSMQETAKEEDPFRLTASASSPWNGVKNAGVTDIHATMDYRRTEWPESDFTMVMEHGSSPDSEVNQFHLSRYKSNPNNIAALTWLGADYNHLQPNVVDWQWKNDLMTTYGVFSPYRIPKPVYYWYQSELLAKPIVHIADETASNSGKIRVFSNCQEIHLYHDNNFIARQKPDNSNNKRYLNHPSFTFNYNWESGKITAVGFSNNEKILEHSRTKQEEPYRIQLNFNITEKPFYAGGSDLRLVHATILDKNGEVITDAKSKVSFSISGNGKILDNGTSDINPATCYNGVASIYIKGTENEGNIKVSATSDGLKSDEITIKTIPFHTNELSKNSKPFFYAPIEKVDIGAKNQLPQFEWNAWLGESNSDLTYSLVDYEGSITISSKNTLEWDGSGAIQGDLSFVAADGVYTENGSIQLKIKNLKKGNYSLETFHHNRLTSQKMINNIEVTKEDANGKVQTQEAATVGYFNPSSTGERNPLSIKTKITSNGKQNILLEFKNTEEANNMWLNGFILQQIR